MDEITEKLKKMVQQKRSYEHNTRTWDIGRRGSQRARTIMQGIHDKVRESTIDYHGNPQNFTGNATKATMGGLATLVASAISPVLGSVALGYTGIKCCQAYCDKQSQGGN